MDYVAVVMFCWFMAWPEGLGRHIARVVFGAKQAGLALLREAERE